MKLRTELSDIEEIVIRCRERNDRIRALELAVENWIGEGDTLTLSSGNTDYYINKTDILYFESNDGHIYAHTADRIYTAPYKLFELESLLAERFVRVSKSAIVNVKRIASLRRELVGNGELTFTGCEKSVWFSRSYYQLLKHKLEEMR